MSSTLNLLQYNHNIITNDTAETLSNSLDIDLSNISETGKNSIASISLPSSTYTELTLASSTSSYTAPADGWVFFSKRAGGTGAIYIKVANTSKGYWHESRSYGSSNGAPATTLPVCSGDTFTVTYTTSDSTLGFNFYYANGAA